MKRYNRSLDFYEKKVTKALENGKVYNKEDRKQWMDQRNHGVSHFGCKPEFLNFENMRFDTMHNKCALTRKCLHWFRNELDRYTLPIQDHFTAYLSREHKVYRYCQNAVSTQACAGSSCAKSIKKDSCRT